MGRSVAISREVLATVPYLDMDEWTPSRGIQSLSFFVQKEWHCWFPANDQLHKVIMMPAEAGYFGDQPARMTDQVFRLLNLNAQRASFLEMRLAANAIGDDFQDLGTSLAKINLFYESSKEKKLDTARFVQTEIEFIVMVCRGVFDLLQEMIRALWQRIELHDKSRRKQNLPKSFADVILHGDNRRTAEEINTKYGLPAAFVDWYISQAVFFIALRRLRNDLNHGGRRAVTALFSTERGFAIFRHDRPWCELYNWPKNVELRNELVPLRPALCSIISRTIEATNSFADMLEDTIVLPKPVCPGLTYYARGYSDRQLWEMQEAIKHSWWCDIHAEWTDCVDITPFDTSE